MYSGLYLVYLISAVIATPLKKRESRLVAPAGCLEVGGSGNYATVQAAVNALSPSSTTSQCIFINAGTYKEQVSILSLKSPLVIYGATEDTSTYSGNQVTITQSRSQSDGLTNDQTATLRASIPNLKVYNINLVNTRGQGSQALAVSALKTQQGYYGVQFKGYQDTVLANEGKQVYAKCYIEGSTDFIFGQKAMAWFERVDIGVLTAPLGWITANGRDSESNPSYYVFQNCKVAAAAGHSVPTGAYYLGRPWRNYSRVVFQNTAMSSVINSAGWQKWTTDTPNTDHVTYAEYKNTGDGAKGTRANFSRQNSAAILPTTILGDLSWVDTRYLS